MPVWVQKSVALAIHDAQIAEHGGLPGLRDDGALEAALDRPRNRHAHGESDVVALAAAYGYGLARNHPFADGNKRVSAVVTELFLALNGAALAVDDAWLVETWLGLSAGTIDEAALAEWLRAHTAPAGEDGGIA